MGQWPAWTRRLAHHRRGSSRSALVADRARPAAQARQPPASARGRRRVVRRRRRRLRRGLAAVRRRGPTPTGRRRSSCPLRRRRRATRAASRTAASSSRSTSALTVSGQRLSVALVFDRRIRPHLRHGLGDADRPGARVRGIRCRRALPRSIGELLAVAEDLRVVAGELEDAPHGDGADDARTRCRPTAARRRPR